LDTPLYMVFEAEGDVVSWFMKLVNKGRKEITHYLTGIYRITYNKLTNSTEHESFLRS